MHEPRATLYNIHMCSVFTVCIYHVCEFDTIVLTETERENPHRVRERLTVVPCVVHSASRALPERIVIVAM